MMQTKYIIQMKMPKRPDLDYYYCGEGKSGAQVFELKKSKAKRYNTMEEVSRDAFILQAVHKASGELYTVLPVRCRT
jgi:hypothetical protein